MFKVISIPSGKEIEACVKFVIGDHEVSITSHRHTGLCVYHNTTNDNVTEQVFGEQEVSYPTTADVIQALQWCEGQRPEAKIRQEKLSLFSDYHKDFYGYRPRCEGWTADEIVSAYDKISAEFSEKKKTREGRDWLRARHWCVDEPERDAESEKDGSAEFGA